MTIMTSKSALSKRGAQYASGPNMREMMGMLLKDPYSKDNPHGVVNIGVAENYAMIPDVVEFVKNKVTFDDKDFTYGEGPWGYEGLRKAMAKHMDKYFKSINKIDADDLLFANGVTSICEMLGYTIADEGDGIIFSRPIYQAFQIDFGAKAKCTPIFTDFDDVDQFALEGVARYEEAIVKAEHSGIKVRALMLCNPHNPLGQCYPKETIIALMRLCEKYSIHLLSDEIYATSIYEVADKEAVPFTSVLSFDTTPYISTDRLHVLYGMSKDFAAGGIRLGCIYIRNKELMRAMSSIGMFGYPSGFTQKFAQTLLEDEEWMANYIEHAQKTLGQKNALVRKMLDEAGVNYHKGANAGFFTWMDLRPWLSKVSSSDDMWEAEHAMHQALLKNKVFVTDGKSLSSHQPGWFRVIFSQHDEVLKEGLKRVFEVIGVDSPTARDVVSAALPLR